MPLANNSTGAGAGEDYNYLNPAMVTGMLSPTDGSVYVYGYDSNKQQVIIKRVQKQAEVPHKGMLPHPVFTNNLVRREFEQTNSAGTTTTYKNLLDPTFRRLSALKDNAVLGSHTHALHGKAGANTRESFEQQKASGQTVTYTNLLPLSILRLKALKENPVSGSTTHALHGKTGVGGLGGFTFSGTGKFKTDRTKQLEDLRRDASFKPVGALHGRAGAFSFKTNEGKNRTNHTQQWLDLRRQSGFKSMGALHGKSGINTRGSATTKNSQGQTISFTNLLSPTVRRLDALSQNPILGSHTHALHGRAGSGGTLVQGKFTTYKTQAKDVMARGGALHGRAGLGGAGNSAFGAVMGALQSVLGFGGSKWPIARFHFYVMIGGTELGFQAVEGLEASVGVIEYRDGNSPFFGKEKMPGLITYEKVTMKKGMFTNDTSANGWFKEIAQDRQYTKRRTIIIALMDNNLVPQFLWRYEQCFLTKVVPTNLDAESENEVAIEELEFVGRAWTLDVLAGLAAGVAGSIAGAAGINLSF